MQWKCQKPNRDWSASFQRGDEDRFYVPGKAAFLGPNDYGRVSEKASRYRRVLQTTPHLNLR